MPKKFKKLESPKLSDESPELLADAKQMANCCLNVYRGFGEELEEIELESSKGVKKKLLEKGKYTEVEEDEAWEPIKDYQASTGPKKADVLIAQLGKLGDDYVVVCRGTQTTEEWKQNAKIGMTQYKINMGKVVEHGKVHEGFYGVFRQFRGELMESIREVKRGLRTGHGARLLVTGHSLGAALATLCAYEIAVRFEDRFQVRMYNFASPRVAGNVFRDNFHGRLASAAFRFVNTKDIVPDVPPVWGPYWWCYHHVGQPFEFTGDGRGTVDHHDMFYYQAMLDSPEEWSMPKQ